MTVIGVDFSLTSTGVCAITDGEAECITVKSAKEDSWHEFPERVHMIGYQLSEWAAERGAAPAWVIESPAFMARSSSLDRMFGGWWLLVDYMMRDCGWEAPLLVTPQRVKKYATNKGNAGKDEVLAAVIRRYPDVLVSGNDQADALTLAAIGAAAYAEPFETLAKYQQEIVEAVRAGKDK